MNSLNKNKRLPIESNLVLNKESSEIETKEEEKQELQKEQINDSMDYWEMSDPPDIFEIGNAGSYTK